jgi:hypothetical protein
LISFFAMSVPDNGNLELRIIYFPIKLFIKSKNTCRKSSEALKKHVLYILNS